MFQSDNYARATTHYYSLKPSVICMSKNNLQETTLLRTYILNHFHFGSSLNHRIEHVTLVFETHNNLQTQVDND